MGAVNTTYTFTATDTITSAKMNNIIDQTTMTTDAIFGTTLEVTSGQLKIRSQGITSNELATGAVTANAIAAGAVTSSGILDGTIVNADINVAAAIDPSKLGAGALAATATVTTANIVDASITAPKLNGTQTGTAPIFGVRAWVTFDMTRNAAGATDALFTPRFLIGSGNVTSVTKTATGVATILFITALPDANYAYTGSGRGSTAANEPIVYNTFAGPKSTTQLGVNMTDTTGGFLNFPEVTVMVVG
tara:strand:- start:247 stop:990 length:744 start_codon:yes stop_codon:yes gene_type:complete